MNRYSTWVFIFSLTMEVTLAQAPAPGCQVKVVTPQAGDKVGAEGRVRGTAKIPNGTYLWVLDHMKDLTEEWWPQGGRPASINSQTGEWVIIAAYGRARDVKEDFEVAAVVVDGNTNTTLRDWFKDAKAKDYPPIEFPNSIDGCPPIKITVRKTSH
jgi:hypothetical protein